jgi:hypothetical protein
MPTDKHRIAAYLPKEVNEKFQVFKKERGVGDSQALIIILSEFLEVSHKVAYSDDSLLVERIEALNREVEDLKLDVAAGLERSKVDLLGELKSELLIKIEQETSGREDKISELFSRLKGDLKSELLNELESKLPKTISTGSSTTKSNTVKSSSKSKSRKQPSKNSTEAIPNNLDILTTAQLVERLKGVERNNTISTKKYNAKDNPEKFVEWSRPLDPDGYGWEFKKDSVLYYRVEPLA